MTEADRERTIDLIAGALGEREFPCGDDVCVPIADYQRLRAALEFIASGTACGPVEVARVALGLKASPTP